MDALSDPRAFMTANKQRDNKMKEMGIEESESSKAAATGGAKPQQAEEEVKRGILYLCASTSSLIVFDMSWLDSFQRK